MFTLVRVFGLGMLLWFFLWFFFWLFSVSHDGSRELNVQLAISNMAGKGLSISVTRLAEDEP